VKDKYVLKLVWFTNNNNNSWTIYRWNWLQSLFSSILANFNSWK